MKKGLKYLIIFCLIISFNSCKTSKDIVVENQFNDKLILDLKNNDYSNSAKEAIILIKNLIKNPEIQKIHIEIYNFHHGIYEQISDIEKKDEHLIIQTIKIGMDKSAKSNSRFIKISDFILHLDTLELNSESQIVAAGNYQKIYITSNQTEKLFLTRKAIGLMHIL